MTRRTCDAAQLALHEDKPGQRVGASIRILVFLGAALLLSSCAAGPNPGVGDGQDPAGFLIGLWHGLIVPVTFVISLFTEQVNVYEVANRGNWYDFGFIVGLMASLGGGGGASAGGRRRARS